MCAIHRLVLTFRKMPMRTPRLRPLLMLPLAAVIGLTGCRSDNPAYMPPEPPKAAASKKPRVVVLDMTNASSFRGRWNLERRMADRLASNLAEQDKLTLLDRSLFNTVAGQVARNGGRALRMPAGVNLDDLKRADYAVHGILTDFRSMGDTSGLFGPTLTAESQAGLACSIGLQVTVIGIRQPNGVSVGIGGTHRRAACAHSIGLGK